jgi:hypothetical protein
MRNAFAIFMTTLLAWMGLETVMIGRARAADPDRRECFAIGVAAGVPEFGLEPTRSGELRIRAHREEISTTREKCQEYMLQANAISRRFRR